jgi:uncharacterized protein (DUF1778 family)
MPRETNRTARIEARLAPDVLALVKRAAEIQGRSVSEFVVSAAQDAARSKTPILFDCLSPASELSPTRW